MLRFKRLLMCRVTNALIGAAIVAAPESAHAQEANGSGASSVSSPSGPGTVTGAGESFSTQLTTGTASYHIPIILPKARGGVQPALPLSYSSAGGFGLVGQGWSLTSSTISRQSDRGGASYDDRDDYHGNQDRFLFGGMELVPICKVASGACTGAQPGEVMPSWASGWQYFRARIEGAFLRFFWSSDHRTWRVQAKDGITLELGVPLDGQDYTGALEFNPEKPSEINRWHLARQYDSHGDVNTANVARPLNSVVYRHFTDEGVVYLSDIYDTSPVTNAADAPVSQYAHHTHLRYEERPDVVTSYKAGWRQRYRQRLVGIDVAVKPATSVTGARELLRRYHFGYAPNLHTSLLASVETEGRCASVVRETAAELLPVTTCPRLPKIELEYQRVASSQVPLRDSRQLSFEPFNTTIRSLSGSPPSALGGKTSLMDVNADGLPDVVVSDPQQYSGAHGVYFNGAGIANGFKPVQRMRVLGTNDVENVDAAALSFDSRRVSALDLDADGRVNLVHVPGRKRYSLFAAEQDALGWLWRGRLVSTASQQDVKIDFTTDAANIRVADVDADGLVDIVVTGPKQVETFFSLGRFQGGDGQFGSVVWQPNGTFKLSNESVKYCIPWSAEAIRFSNPEVRLADMNGDGYVDLVRARDGQVSYWPGRGNGFWGTGRRTGCDGSGLADRHAVVMTNAPRLGSVKTSSVVLSDVNGDGLADLVEARQAAVDVYLNDNAGGWSDRVTIAPVPMFIGSSRPFQLTDIDGSGTPDLLWGVAKDYKFVDLTGGVTPYLLQRVHNGLGRTTDFEYKSSTELMLAAQAAGTPWTSTAPTVMPVLVRETVRDHRELIGQAAGVYTTEYSYADPVFEGRQREFRGFRTAQVKTLGDTNSPTSIQRSTFLLGECVDTAGQPGTCKPEDRWRDNWREALKGLPAVVEASTENGVYLTTKHHTYELRELYMGRDGRRVMQALNTITEGFTYDAVSFVPTTSTVSMPEVKISLQGQSQVVESRLVPKRASTGTVRTRSSITQDVFGNVTQLSKEGCVEGCTAADEIINTTSSFARPTGDASGWSFRESTSYVTGSVQTARRQELVFSYDSLGRLLTTSGKLTGGVALRRVHDVAGTRVAPAPTAASAGLSSAVATVLLSTNSYDQFGNVTKVVGANNRCAGRVTDAQYAEFAVEEVKYVGALGPDGCGATQIRSTATYDRGLQQMRSTVSATGQLSQWTYDGYGRLTAAYAPNPESPGTAAVVKTYSYALPTDGKSQPYYMVVDQVIDSPTFSARTLRVTYSYFDSMGRPLFTLREADKASGDGGKWIVSGPPDYNRKGMPFRQYEPWFTDTSPSVFPLSTRPATAYTTNVFDAFGRMTEAYGQDGKLKSRAVTRPLQTDVWDAEDLSASANAGTYASKIIDGHGRTVQTISRIAEGGTIKENQEFATFLPTGEMTVLRLRRPGGGADYVRWQKFDSLGRRVLNVEPNTTTAFNANPATWASAIGWRYAYNDAGDLVGLSDARGCGVNFFYDAGGRKIGEDYSPCTAAQDGYSPPNLTTGDGLETFIRYDVADAEAASIVDGANNPFSQDSRFLLGRVTATMDRGSKLIANYDALGRVVGVARKMARPGPTAVALVDRYAPRWYVRELALDSLDRIKSETTGNTLPELMGADGLSKVTYSYTGRGLTKAISGSYGTLFRGSVVDAKGQLLSSTLGDLAETQRAFSYDVLGRVKTVETFRAQPSLWTTPAAAGAAYQHPLPGAPPTRQMELENYEFTYDEVGNPTKITDWRDGADWPSHAKPVTRTYTYDSFYRLTGTTYEYQGGDTWKSAYAAEHDDQSLSPQPSPQTSLPTRVKSQTNTFDWKGNFVTTRDDKDAFYDRSLGTVVTSGAPHRLTSASNTSIATPNRGALTAAYDAAGNMTDLVVRRDGSCLPAGASCWQRFKYEWDENGQLQRARRWDLSVTERAGHPDPALALPSRPADADLRYVMADAGRAVKTVVEADGTQTHSVYVFPTLELRGASWTNNDYEYSLDTVEVRANAGVTTARIVVPEQATPRVDGTLYRVLLTFSDYLGSSSFVIDKATSELVESSTYQSYGATEGSYRTARWNNERDPYRFNGKEDDIEVGLSYYGARFYSPLLGRFISPDAVTIHNFGSDRNPYSYGSNRPTAAVDPDGNLAFLVVVAVVIVISAATNAAVQYAQTGHIDWGLRGVAGAAIAGAVGAVVGAGVGGLFTGPLASLVFGSVAGGAFAAGTSTALQGGNVRQVLQSAGIGAISGLMGSLAGAGVGALASQIIGESLGEVGGAIVCGAAGGVAGGAAGAIASGVFSGSGVRGEDIGIGIASGAISGAVMGALSAKPEEQPDKERTSGRPNKEVEMVERPVEKQWDPDHPLAPKDNDPARLFDPPNMDAPAAKPEARPRQRPAAILPEDTITARSPKQVASDMSGLVEDWGKVAQAEQQRQERLQRCFENEDAANQPPPCGNKCQAEAAASLAEVVGKTVEAYRGGPKSAVKFLWNKFKNEPAYDQSKNVELNTIPHVDAPCQ